MGDDNSERRTGLDVLRGGLLVAMLAVHVLSAHAAAAQASAMHAWVGVFLISSGFVGLSGFIVGSRPGPAGREGWLKAVDAALHLIAVMVAYGLALSLLRHGLCVAAGGELACSVRDGWRPPERFGSLGILLPVALVQLLAPLARSARGVALAAAALLAAAWMVLPALTAGLPAEGPSGAVVGALTRRTLTPFYTVSSFVAIGLACALLGRAFRAWTCARGEPALSTALRVGCVLAAIALAVPRWSKPLLDQAYRGGQLAGALATLAFWVAVIALLVVAFVTWRPGGRAAAALAILGKSSLAFFVLHDLLLELNTLARVGAGLDKGPAIAIALVAANLALLAGALLLLERSGRLREGARRLLLVRGGTPTFLRRLDGQAIPLLLVLASVLAVYSAHAVAPRPSALVVDDFEREGCPRWWTFGQLELRRVPSEPTGRAGHHFEVKGRASGMTGHGFGLFPDQDVGALRTLNVDVYGHGPGSGRIKFELVEDDNGNWEAEKVDFVPIYDDRFVREVTVDWQGWRHLVLPVSSFVDDNPRGGNGIFDPERDLTSGGLLEIQLLISPSGAEDDHVQLGIDNLRWTR